MDSHIAQGTWTPQESRMHINLLGLRTVREACKALLQFILSHHVFIMLDNKTNAFYISKHGGVKSIPPICTNGHPMELVYQESNHSISLLSGNSESVGGHTQQVLYQRSWVGVAWYGSKQYLWSVGDPPPGICLSPKWTGNANLLFQRSSRSTLSGWHTLPPLVRTSMLSLSSLTAPTLGLMNIRLDRPWVILTTPNWPRHFWFPNLLRMSSHPLISIQSLLYLLTQEKGRIKHPSSEAHHLMGWFFDGHQSKDIPALKPYKPSLIMAEKIPLRIVIQPGGITFPSGHSRNTHISWVSW